MGLDECGNPRIIKKCPAKVEMLNGCPEHQYPCDVKNECNCSLCEPQCCCKCPEDDPNTKCGPCEVKEQEFSRDGRCTKTKCVKRYAITRRGPTVLLARELFPKRTNAVAPPWNAPRFPAQPSENSPSAKRVYYRMW